MPESKKNNDASGSIKGILYQFYISVEKCFELLENEKVIIEKDGDISTENEQIEVKQYKTPLTDSHENIWKTIFNWMQDNFDHTIYKHVILLTTQQYGENSQIKNWNDKSTDEKYEILKKIALAAKKREENKENKKGQNLKDEENKILKMMESVLAEEKSEKLCAILSKFLILDSSPIPSDYFENIKQKFCKPIFPSNKNTFMYSLLGFIICPKTVEDNWEIDYDSFTKEVSKLTEIYCKETKIFPKKYDSYMVSNEDCKEVEKYRFIKIIEDINYREVINTAITDYIKTQKTLQTEISERIAKKSVYTAYEQNLLDHFSTRFRYAKRNCSKANIINDSQNFYDEIIGEYPPTFETFSDTPIYFKNGTIHNLANDISNNIQWKLEN